MTARKAPPRRAVEMDVAARGSSASGGEVASRLKTASGGDPAKVRAREARYKKHNPDKRSRGIRGIPDETYHWYRRMAAQSGLPIGELIRYAMEVFRAAVESGEQQIEPTLGHGRLTLFPGEGADED